MAGRYLDRFGEIWVKSRREGRKRRGVAFAEVVRRWRCVRMEAGRVREWNSAGSGCLEGSVDGFL